MVADRMALASNPGCNVRPPFGVAAKNEKGRLHIPLGERVQYQRSRVGIGAVVKRQRDGSSGGAEPGDWPAENWTVSMKGAMRCDARDDGTGAEAEDHTPTATFP